MAKTGRGADRCGIGYVAAGAVGYPATGRRATQQSQGLQNDDGRKHTAHADLVFAYRSIDSRRIAAVQRGHGQFVQSPVLGVNAASILRLVACLQQGVCSTYNRQQLINMGRAMGGVLGAILKKINTLVV